MARLSKRIKQLREQVDRTVVVSVDEAFAQMKALATAKFDESVDVSVNLGVDPRKSDQVVRGATVMPNGTGKTVRVAVFAQGDAAELQRGPAQQGPAQRGPAQGGPTEGDAAKPQQPASTRPAQLSEEKPGTALTAQRAAGEAPGETPRQKAGCGRPRPPGSSGGDVRKSPSRSRSEYRDRCPQ